MLARSTSTNCYSLLLHRLWWGSLQRLPLLKPLPCTKPASAPDTNCNVARERVMQEARRFFAPLQKTLHTVGPEDLLVFLEQGWLKQHRGRAAADPPAAASAPASFTPDQVKAGSQVGQRGTQMVVGLLAAVAIPALPTPLRATARATAASATRPAPRRRSPRRP